MYNAYNTYITSPKDNYKTSPIRAIKIKRYIVYEDLQFSRTRFEFIIL